MVDENDDWVKQAAEKRKAREAPEAARATAAAAAHRAWLVAAQKFWSSIQAEILELVKRYNATYGSAAISRASSRESEQIVHLTANGNATLITGVDLDNRRCVFISAQHGGRPPKNEEWRLVGNAEVGVHAEGISKDPKIAARALVEEWIKTL